MLKGFLISLLLLSTNVFADNKIYTKCIEGYLFVVSETTIDMLDGAKIVNIEQLIEIPPNSGIPMPKKCEEK
jgi:hypothetical protein